MTKEIQISEEKHLVLEGDPEKQIDYAQKASKALITVLKNKKDKVVIRGKQYLVFEDWQTLARFYGVTVGIEWTKPITENGIITGYEARAVAYHRGEIISAAEAMCMKNEDNWRGRPEFMVRSMAQTRASAKTLRNILAWVAVMGGFAGTPAEEMDGLYASNSARTKPQKQDTPDKEQGQKNIIFLLLKRLQVPKEKMADWVKNKTELELLPENYEEIISMLEIIEKEK